MPSNDEAQSFKGVAALAGIATLCGAGICVCWYSYIDKNSYYLSQRAAFCKDGLFDDSLMMVAPMSANILLAPGPKGGRTTYLSLRCLIPLAVYRCNDEDIKLGTWRGECKDLELAPLLGSPLPCRDAGEVLVCRAENIWASNASRGRRDCADSDYQEASLSCQRRLRHDQYSCFVSGNEVRIEAASDPQGALALAIFCTVVVAICLCACCCSDSRGTACICGGGLSFGLLAVLTLLAFEFSYDPQEGFVQNGGNISFTTSMIAATTITIATTSTSTSTSTDASMIVSTAHVAGTFLLVVLLSVFALAAMGLALFQIMSHGKDARKKVAAEADAAQAQSVGGAAPLERLRSLQELNELVINSSILSRREVIAHRLLSLAEASSLGRMAFSLRGASSAVLEGEARGFGSQDDATPPAKSIGLEDIEIQELEHRASIAAQRSLPTDRPNNSMRGWWMRPRCLCF